MTILKSMDRETVQSFLREWERMFHDGDWRGMANEYADDGILIATGRETITGRPAIAEFFREACGAVNAAGIRREIALARAEQSGGLGYIRGTVLLHPRDEADPVRFRYLTLWKQAPDGGWQLAVDISTPAPGVAIGIPDEAAERHEATARARPAPSSRTPTR